MHPRPGTSKSLILRPAEPCYPRGVFLLANRFSPNSLRPSFSVFSLFPLNFKPSSEQTLGKNHFHRSPSVLSAQREKVRLSKVRVSELRAGGSFWSSESCWWCFYVLLVDKFSRETLVSAVSCFFFFSFFSLLGLVLLNKAYNSSKALASLKRRLLSKKN